MFNNMEKKQSKNTILKLLPKASSVIVGFQNAPFNPSRDNKPKPHHHHGNGKGFFSGPLMIIPDESRKKKKKPSNNNNVFESDDHQEPTSPKISCMGQIKHKKEKIKSKCPKHNHKTTSFNSRPVEKQGSFKLKGFLNGMRSRRSRSDADNSDISVKDEMSQMKRFVSSRDAFADFDWTAQISPEEDDDEDRTGEVFIPFSAPLLRTDIKGLQPKKEINLWKRRTMDPPRPLQLNTMVKAR